MTDRSDEDRRSRRFFGYAVLGSLLVHVVGIFLWGVATYRFASLQAVPKPTPSPDIVVTISRATTIRKRSHPIPVPRPHRAAAPAAPAAQPAVQQQPKPVAQVVPRPPVETPHALHELVKPLPTAEPNPPKTVRTTPSPEPIAKAAPATQTQPRTARGQGHTLSQSQIAHIGQEMQKTIAQLRAESDPLAVHATATPAVEKRYRIQMNSIAGSIRHFQGSCVPIKSWTEGKYDYYYETCDFAFSDGSVDTEAVPWPIRFEAGHDLYHGDLGNHVTIPLQLPLPGWKLAPGQFVGDGLKLYAKDNGIEL